MRPKDFARSAGTLVRTSDGHQAFVPGSLPPKLEITWPLANHLSLADRKLSELGGIARNLPNPHLLIQPFTRKEAVLSSRIEGTVASLSDLFSFEALGSIGELPDDVIEVSNYVVALEWGLKRLKTLPVSLRLIRELHERLMKGVRGYNMMPGEFRRSQNWIGGPGCRIAEAKFVPPPPVEMKKSLESLEIYLHSSGDIPPLIRLAIVHYQFEAIHPFLDGNGRIGRLLITLLMVSSGLLPQPLLYLSAYFERNRSEYYRLLLEVSQHGAWQEWISFFLQGVTEQSAAAFSEAQRLGDLEVAYKKRFDRPRVTAALLRTIDFLFTGPIVTVKSVATHLSLSQPAAQAIIDKLANAKILEEVTGKGKGRIYVAKEILASLESDTPRRESEMEDQTQS